MLGQSNNSHYNLIGMRTISGERPPVSDVDFQNEVSTYGMIGFTGDINDDWTVEIEKGDRSDRVDQAPEDV